MAVVIQAEHLGKRYRLGEGGYVTLREKLHTSLRPTAAKSDGRREVWALRDVDLEIDEGDVVGIVGRNGAGKTTFLKTVARIVRPTTGVVRVRGRVGALLEVGTGFHPELTGRENVFLNGVVLGMSRREIRRRFDDIVEFAGVERFLETPLKRYSTGMYLRLAFAVAAHIDPDILIVDEVLAVGDAEFRQRSLGRMSEFGREGRTILFVSHDTGSVGQLCRRAIWLEQGRVKADGATQEVLAQYLESTVQVVPEVHVQGHPDSPVEHVAVAVRGAAGATTAPRRDEPFTIAVGFATSERTLALDANIFLLNQSGQQVLSENLSDDGTTLNGPPQVFTVQLTVPPVLAAGDYTVGVWVGTEYESYFYGELITFSLLPRPDDRDEWVRRRRSVHAPVTWAVEARPSQPGSERG
jgi:ABC-2 type transport system ATP-binding protein/lipopolysaccharide transport system ATP-binding protein